MPTESHVHVVGLGLIGASVAAGLSGVEGATRYRVTGWDREAHRRRRAREQGSIERAVPPDRLPEDVQGVILAVPVPEMVGVAREILEGEHRPRYMTDTGSTKSWICGQMEELLPPSVDFVGAHPMAGSEESGPEASDPILFENAICVVTPGENPGEARRSVVGLWEDLGGHVVEMGPLDHDRSVAYISHLPHLVAAGLLHAVPTAEGTRESAFALAAGGFRDMTRVATGDPELWRDIIGTNTGEVESALEGFASVIDRVRRIVHEARWEDLTEWLRRAGRARESLPEKTKGLVGGLHELRILAPDEPGILAEVTGLLAEASVNVTDIEVLRVREGEIGSIKLGFRRPEERDEARRVLRERADRVRLM